MAHQGTHRFKSPSRNASASQMCSEAMETARETISSNPGTSVFTAFAAGMGIGIGLALVFAGRPQPSYDLGMREKFSQWMNELPWMRN